MFITVLSIILSAHAYVLVGYLVFRIDDPDEVDRDFAIFMSALWPLTLAIAGGCYTLAGIWYVITGYFKLLYKIGNGLIEWAVNKELKWEERKKLPKAVVKRRS